MLAASFCWTQCVDYSTGHLLQSEPGKLVQAEFLDVGADALYAESSVEFGSEEEHIYANICKSATVPKTGPLVSTATQLSRRFPSGSAMCLVLSSLLVNFVF